MYQKEAHAFFVPLLYQLLDVYGGGKHAFFFYPNVMDIRRNVTLNVIDSIAIIVCRKACVIRWQNVSHDT